MSIDTYLERSFASAGDRLNRGRFLRRTGLALGAIAGYSVVTQPASATHCGANYGRCDGCLCCGQYDGCSDETGLYCGNRPSGCFVNTGKWSACCGTERYDWWDCCFMSDGGGCCGAGGSPGNCTGGSCTSWCGSCYRCTFRIIVAGGC